MRCWKRPKNLRRRARTSSRPDGFAVSRPWRAPASPEPALLDWRKARSPQDSTNHRRETDPWQLSRPLEPAKISIPEATADCRGRGICSTRAPSPRRRASGASDGSVRSVRAALTRDKGRSRQGRGARPSSGARCAGPRRGAISTPGPALVRRALRKQTVPTTSPKLGAKRQSRRLARRGEKGAADSADLPLSRYLGGPTPTVLPVTDESNVINVARTLTLVSDVQEFMILPVRGGEFQPRPCAGAPETYTPLKGELKAGGFSTGPWRRKAASRLKLPGTKACTRFSACRRSRKRASPGTISHWGLEWPRTEFVHRRQLPLRGLRAHGRRDGRASNSEIVALPLVTPSRTFRRRTTWDGFGPR